MFFWKNKEFQAAPRRGVWIEININGNVDIYGWWRGCRPRALMGHIGSIPIIPTSQALNVLKQVDRYGRDPYAERRGSAILLVQPNLTIDKIINLCYNMVKKDKRR